MLNNPTIQSINARHSIRTFSQVKIPVEQIQTILNAANQAPSAHNRQSWKFILVEGDKKNALSDLISKKSKDFVRPSSSLLRMAARSIISAPTVIAVANTGDLIQHGTDLFKVSRKLGYDFFRTMEIQSSAAAVENLLLAATSLGIASVWLGILFLIKDEVLKFLEEPIGEFMAVIPMGYALKQGHNPHKKSLDFVLKKL